MKTNSWLVKYAKSKVGNPYWFGCYGQKGSAALYKAKKKQYPKYYTATDYPKQYGQRVYDCAGLIKAALWTDSLDGSPKYNSKQDFGATGLYNHAKKKGEIKTFDKVNGRLVFKGTAKTKTHVGVYCSDGYVREAKGHKYGVVKTKFKASDWTYWAQCHLFEEDPAPAPAPAPTPEPTPAPEPTVEKYKVVTNRDPLRLRAEPNLKSKILDKIPKGTTIPVDKTVDGWAHTVYKGKSGYCYMKYLKKV